MIHGTRDDNVPYYNALACHERAQEEGIPSDMIAYENAGHGPWRKIFKDFTNVAASIYRTISTGAEEPAGCSFEQSADWNEINFAQSLQ